MSALIRLIARLDIKGQHVIKSIQLEGLRIIDEPQCLARKYYENGIDEILYMDVVASLYGRNNLIDIVKQTAKNIFVPITVGGGIRSLQDIQILLNSGADRVAINTAAIKNPMLLKEAAEYFGAQCIILSIEAKRIGPTLNWEAYYDNGREPSGLDVIAWAKQGEVLGVGEILLTSVDKEGTREGFDIELVRAVTEAVNIPVIASGGFGKPSDFVDAVTKGQVSAVAIADAFHYGRHEIHEIREAAKHAQVSVREV